MSDDGGPSTLLRQERAEGRVDRLRADVARWLDTWQGSTAQAGQIARLGAILSSLVDRLAARARTIARDGFVVARQVDGDLAVVERVWRYYADRFEQRHDEDRAATLFAADQLILSCARALPPAAGGGLAVPLPLAYLEPAYSPTAIPRSEPKKPPEVDAADTADVALAEILRFLPVPLIGLPTSVIDEPWWLVLVAHEVGHHVQYDLGEGALIEETATILGRAGGKPWRRWSREVFADAFALATLGSAAAAATAELEWGTPDAMAEERGAYPPVLVRLALMGFARDELLAIAARVGDEVARERVADWIGRAGAAAGELANLPLGGTTLAAIAEVCAPGDVAKLDDALDGDDRTKLKESATRPLHAAACAFARYQTRIANVRDPSDDGRRRRDQARKELRKRYAPLIDRVKVSADLKRGPDEAKAIDDTAVIARIEDVLRRGRR